MLIGMLFLGSVQLFFIGFLGEYIMSINQRVMKRPLVIEEERLNFDQKDENAKGKITEGESTHTVEQLVKSYRPGMQINLGVSVKF